MYANLPFWAEKMPELPDLIYQNLKQQHQSSHLQTVPAPVSHKPLILSVFAGAAMVVSGLCYLQNDFIASSIAASCSLIGFILAWRSA